MFDVDRTVIGSKRRRWHPGNPFHMKRHGDTLNLPPPSLRQRHLPQPIMETVNETYGRAPQIRLTFSEKSPQLTASTGNFEDW
jgi:hypothetical protein